MKNNNKLTLKALKAELELMKANKASREGPQKKGLITNSSLLQRKH